MSKPIKFILNSIGASQFGGAWKELSEKLIRPLSLWINSVDLILNNGITFRDNLASETMTITWNNTMKASNNPAAPLLVRTQSPTLPRSLLILKTVNTENSFVCSSFNQVNWEYVPSTNNVINANSGRFIKINDILGLEDGIQYKVDLILLSD